MLYKSEPIVARHLPLFYRGRIFFFRPERCLFGGFRVYHHRLVFFTLLSLYLLPSRLPYSLRDDAHRWLFGSLARAYAGKLEHDPGPPRGASGKR